ncbi:MAG TPA: type IV pilus biogenesis/stability protein PilW [Steroidobacteraceae bacterium]|nr:type IV pilus biogenesis/stability protein PilW [Steroidobacteraceae bacterium]
MRKQLLTCAALCVMLSACATQQSSMPKAQPERAAEINLELGIDYLRKGNLEQAKEKIDRALEQDSRNAKAQAAAGLLYDRLGEQNKSESHFERAISLDSKNPEIRNNFAAILCQRGKYERGEKMALAAISDPLYKTPEVALMNAGNCRRSAGDVKGAEEHFRKALERKPRFGPALYQLADLEFGQQNYMPARAFLERYMEVARANSASLWLAYRIERQLGNAAAADSYARRLRNEFPTSNETKELIQSERRPG